MAPMMTIAAIDQQLESLQLTVVQLRSNDATPGVFLKLRRIRELQDGWLDKRISTMKAMRNFHV